MIFRVYEEGCSRGDKDYRITVDGPNARAMAAAQFCASRECRDDEPYNVVVCPADDEATALPGWQHDEEEPYHVHMRVEPAKRVRWTAEQVRGFGLSPAVSGPVPNGERAEIEVP